jgi:small GTP-binding protein
MRETKVKVVLLGDTTVGKTSIARRQALNSFDFKMFQTVGIDHLASVVKIGNEAVRLMVWDTAGQEEFASLVPICMRGAQVCIIVGSIVDPRSCDNVTLWHERLCATREGAQVILAINKMDLLDGARYDRGGQEKVPDAIPTSLFRLRSDRRFDRRNVPSGSPPRTRVRTRRPKVAGVHAERAAGEEVLLV